MPDGVRAPPRARGWPDPRTRTAPLRSSESMFSDIAIMPRRLAVESEADGTRGAD